jgi:hypothetical protein
MKVVKMWTWSWEGMICLRRVEACGVFLRRVSKNYKIKCDDYCRVSASVKYLTKC